MGYMINENFVIVGAILSLIGSLDYVVGTIKGKTQPNRATWFLWALAPLIAVGAMLSEGVSWQGVLMTFMVGFGPLLVFLSSFVNKKSVWKLTWFDYLCGILSIIGIIGWLIAKDAKVALIFSIAADALALLPTLVKSWKSPKSERSLVFLLASLNAIITLLTITVWDFTHVGFPIYILIACFGLFVIIRFQLGVRFRKAFQKR